MTATTAAPTYTTLCACGCDGLVNGEASFVSGHDSRLVQGILREVWGDGTEGSPGDTLAERITRAFPKQAAVVRERNRLT